MNMNFKIPFGAVLAIMASLLPMGPRRIVFAADYPFNAPSLPADVRAADLVSRLTLSEKISQMGNEVPAIPRLGIDKYNYWNEACHGIQGDNVTVFPQAIGLSASWDLDLEYEIANAVSDEARALNNSKGRGLTYWAPTINMCRDPRWGRNEEGYGEDPYLVKKFAVNFVKGMQGVDPKYLKTVATVKHFACNNVESYRAGISSNVDERSLREYYLPAFKAAVVEGKVYSVMGAYNALNHIPCNANKMLLTDILRKEWGFKGYVVSDCGAIEYITAYQGYVPTFPMAAVVGCKAGCDLNCGGTYQRYLPIALQSSLWSIGEADIDTAVKRIFKARILLGEFDPPTLVPYTSIPVTTINSREHQDLNLKAARESIVLLKNNGILPLDTGKIKTISVIGPNANVCRLGGYSGNPDFSITPLRGILNKIGISKGKKVLYSQGCDINALIDQSVFDQAVNNAINSDAVIMFMGTDNDYVGEGRDLNSLNLPGVQDALIQAVYSVNPNTIVVLINGNPLAIKWMNKNIPGIVEAWYAGQSQGTAIVDVLFGDYNPGGKLTATWVQSTEDLPDMQDYRIFNNRTYMYYKGTPLYPFGFGLSYTTFEYGNLRISSGTISPGKSITVSVDVKNIGTRSGDEVAQVYIHDKISTLNTANKKLKGFMRVPLKPDETKTVDFALPFEELSNWDTTTHAFVVENGAVQVLVGSSSADIRDSGEIIVSTVSDSPGVMKRAHFLMAKQKSRNNFRITVTGAESSRIDILNCNGRLVQSFHQNGSSNIIWHPPAPGLYFVKMSQGAFKSVEKVIADR